MRRVTDHQIPSTESAAPSDRGVGVCCTAEADGHRSQYLVEFVGGETRLEFAHQPIGEQFLPGVTNEALIAIVIDRLRGFQETSLRCRENACALTKLDEAMHWLHARTFDRLRRGVASPHEA